MELILSNYDDKDENSRQIEELSQANHDLLEQNERLKAQLDQSSAVDGHSPDKGVLNSSGTSSKNKGWEEDKGSQREQKKQSKSKNSCRY